MDPGSRWRSNSFLIFPGYCPSEPSFARTDRSAYSRAPAFVRSAVARKASLWQNGKLKKPQLQRYIKCLKSREPTVTCDEADAFLASSSLFRFVAKLLFGAMLEINTAFTMKTAFVIYSYFALYFTIKTAFIIKTPNL